MQAARKWGKDGDEKTVLDYSQKDNEEAAAEGKLDLSKPLADLTLKSRVDEFDDEEEGTACSIMPFPAHDLLCGLQCQALHCDVYSPCSGDGCHSSASAKCLHGCWFPECIC